MRSRSSGAPTSRTGWAADFDAHLHRALGQDTASSGRWPSKAGTGWVPTCTPLSPPCGWPSGWLRTATGSVPRPRRRLHLEGTRTDDCAHGLTRREREVLMVLADGRTNEQIAAELFMSPKTASVHVSRIISKLGVANRTEAAVYAHRNGLVAT